MSQTTRILSYLRKGKTLTPLEALRKFGSLRLGARIHNLRDEGYKIRTTKVRIGEKSVARYSMEGV